MQQAIAVVDIGKTRSKLSLLTPDGAPLLRADYANRTGWGVPLQLDIEGIAAWLKAALAHAARQAQITAIVPVGHGAAGVLMRPDGPFALDYDAEPPVDIALAYDGLRDPFEATLSPRLGAGLNLGAQLFWLERLFPGLWPARGDFLLWPQYWAWWLSGERASEITSLGCHSDLWRPLEGRFSDLAILRGWTGRLGPIRHAGEVLGAVRPELADALGLSRRCVVYCGLHDSNAALHAARGFPPLASGPVAVVSTGTWFVCLSVGGDAPVRYDPDQDMLANVDVDGRTIPTARFPGGRDYESWMGAALGAASDPALLAATASGWRNAPPPLRATHAALELARRTDRCLTLIGASGPILLEGRFAADDALAAALRALRPRQPLLRSDVADTVALGALRLAMPSATANLRLQSG